MFILTRLEVAIGLINNKLSNQTELEKIVVGLMVFSFAFGSWIVFLVASRKQKNQSTSKTVAKDQQNEL